MSAGPNQVTRLFSDQDDGNRMNMHDSGHPPTANESKSLPLFGDPQVVFYKGLTPRLLTVRCRTATIDT
jgi:hypothetical protein